MGDSTVNVLQVLIGGKTFTGVASYLYQQYTHIDRSRVHYDFLFCRENAMELVMHDEVFSDSQFISLNAIRKNSSVDYHMFIKGLRSAIAAKQYDYIVVNTSVVEFVLACLIAVRNNKNIKFVAHAHNTDIVISRESVRYKLRGIVDFVENFIRKKIRKEATYLFACSENAGIITFGEEVTKSSKFSIIRNAIDIDSFKYDMNARKRIRNEIGVTDEDVVYGNIGSLCVRKNQLFLLNVFKEISQTEPNAKLWIIGDGELKQKLMQKTEELGLSDQVLFLGQRTDVNALMQGFDCFVFTTKSEGLGIVAIEAQAAGLPTIVSDGVPDDVVITDMCMKINLSDGEEKWASEVIRFRKQNMVRMDYSTQLSQAGYDINISAQEMLKYYKK